MGGKKISIRDAVAAAVLPLCFKGSDIHTKTMAQEKLLPGGVIPVAVAVNQLIDNR